MAPGPPPTADGSPPAADGSTPTAAGLTSTSDGSTPTAVFDLDGTLLRGDSTAAWLVLLLRSSAVRCVAAVITLPVSVPLIWLKATRRIGASILLWIATVGVDKKALEASMDALAKSASIGWHNEGLETLNRHRAAGDRVVVVTAAPAWLAARLAPDVQVLGSTLARRWGGWIISQHCHGLKKLRALEQNGYGTSWDYAYTDSLDDAPLLGAATKRGYLVNARPGVVAKLAKESNISQLRWT